MEISNLIFVCIIALFSTFANFILGIHEEITNSYKKRGFIFSIGSFIVFLVSLSYIIYSLLNGTLH